MTSHTAPITPSQAESLRTLLAARHFTFIEKPHTLFAAKHDDPKLSISVYTKGPKVLVQGKATGHFVTTVFEPDRYNDLYATFGNVNRLLAWGHAAVIEHLLTQQPDCPRALSDQFTDAAVLRGALQQKGRSIQLDQRTKAESDPAVAAASILAREAFIDWLRDKATDLDLPGPLPKGVSPKVIETTRALVATHGPNILPQIAKTHFTTTRQIIP